MAIEKFIQNEVKGNDVVLFMKGTPQFPMCGFSGQVVQILDHLGEFVGGCDIIREMFQAGELQSLLKEKGVVLKERAST